MEKSEWFEEWNTTHFFYQNLIFLLNLSNFYWKRAWFYYSNHSDSSFQHPILWFYKNLRWCHEGKGENRSVYWKGIFGDIWKREHFAKSWHWSSWRKYITWGRYSQKTFIKENWYSYKSKYTDSNSLKL